MLSTEELMVLNCGVVEHFEVPWTAWRSNQSTLKDIDPEYPLEALMLKLKLPYLATCWKELTHWERPRWWERLKAGRQGDDRGCVGGRQH